MRSLSSLLSSKCDGPIVHPRRVAIRLAGCRRPAAGESKALGSSGKSAANAILYERRAKRLEAIFPRSNFARAGLTRRSRRYWPRCQAKCRPGSEPCSSSQPMAGSRTMPSPTGWTNRTRRSLPLVMRGLRLSGDTPGIAAGPGTISGHQFADDPSRHDPSSDPFGRVQPCLGNPTRFAPFADAAGACFPTLYAATNREAAAFESILHDVDARTAFIIVPLEVVLKRSFSQIAHHRDLRLASLFALDLKRLNIERRDSIDTPASTYDQTVLWAKAIHRTHPDVDGLIWTSRRCDPEQCVVLFGDRVPESAFDVVDGHELATDSVLLLEIRDYGRRAGITLVS
jgi:hypothetical protein